MNTHEVQAFVAAAVKSARQAAAAEVTKYLAESGEITFFLDGVVRHLADNAPMSAKSAATFLIAQGLAYKATKGGNATDAAAYAFVSGLLTSEGWCHSEHGVLLADLLETHYSEVTRGKKISDARKNSAALPETHWSAVKDFIQRESQKSNAAAACRQAAAHLAVGTLPGLPGVVVTDLTPKTLQNRYSSRNKSSR